MRDFLKDVKYARGRAELIISKSPSGCLLFQQTKEVIRSFHSKIESKISSHRSCVVGRNFKCRFFLLMHVVVECLNANNTSTNKEGETKKKQRKKREKEVCY